MGRESTITYDQVAAEADRMIAEGGKPNQRTIRDRLGTGSMSTILKYLQEWRDVRRGSPAATAMVIPPALQRALVEFMEQELAARLAPAEARLAEQRQEVDDLVAENQRQAEQIAAQGEDMARLAEEKAAAEGKTAQLEADLVAARKEVAGERQAAEMARTELAKAQLRLEAMPRLEADLATTRNDLVAERQARTAADQSVAVLTSQKADLATRVEQIAGDLVKAQTRMDVLTGERDQARQSQALAERDQIDLERERTASREWQEKAADAAGSIKVLREMLAAVTAELERYKIRRDEKAGATE